MSDLSNDAKSVAASMFGMGPNQKLSFGMVEMKPTERMQIALDELVEAGWITVEKINQFGSVEYTSQKPDECRDLFKQAMSGRLEVADIKVAEPVKS